MQAVILAAGRGSRMGKLTEDRPKPMIELAGKPLLEYKFDVLPDDVTDVIVVVGYFENVIRERFGSEYHGRKIVYVTQENPVGGTADALWKAKDILKENFFVLNGDDLYAREDLDALRVYDWAILVQRVADTAGRAKVIMDVEHRVIDIIESSEGGGEGIVNTASYVLDTRIFDYPQIPKATGSRELGIPQTIIAASKVSGIPLNVVEAVGWIQIKNPEALAQAEARLKS